MLVPSSEPRALYAMTRSLLSAPCQVGPIIISWETSKVQCIGGLHWPGGRASGSGSRASVSDGLVLGVRYLIVSPMKVVCSWGWHVHNSPEQIWHVARRCRNGLGPSPRPDSFPGCPNVRFHSCGQLLCTPPAPCTWYLFVPSMELWTIDLGDRGPLQLLGPLNV